MSTLHNIPRPIKVSHKIFFLTALNLLFANLSHAQWLETTIYIPDSLCGVVEPQAFTYNADNNKIYVGGEYGHCVIAIDGATNQKIARIPAGSNIRALCWNSTNNKVYCANDWSHNVTVIDGETNSVITTILVGDEPCAFTWNSVQNRTYVANYYGSSISVIRDVVIGIDEISGFRDKHATLRIYSNPFHSSTRITYGLAKSCNVVLKIYNIAGQCVKTLVNLEQNAGIYEINWQGKDNGNRRLPQGIYFLQMEAGDYTATAKIVLLH